MIKRAVPLIVGLATVAGCGQSLHAGADTSLKKSIVEPAPESESPSLTEVNADSSYVFESGFRRGAGKYGDQDAVQSHFEAAHRILLSSDWFGMPGRWFLKIGADYERFDFGTSGAPVPSKLQSAAAVIALQYFEGRKLGLVLETRPGVYFSDDVTGNSFDAPTYFAFAYRLGSSEAYLILGAAFASLREYPILPLVGLNWEINSQWLLAATLPEPKLIYTVSDRLSLWVGGELTGNAYRTDKRTVTPSKLSGAVLSYVEYRGGGGLTYKVCSGFTVDAAAGYVFLREFDYHRAGEKYGLDGAAYLKLAGHAEF